MKLTLKHAAAVILMLSFAAPAVAGPFEDAVAAEKKGDHERAERLFMGLALQGDANAGFYLGFKYEYGRGVPQDYAKARLWYRIAADKGSANAQHNLGDMYSQGKGVPQDYAEAVKWYEKAANDGDADHKYRWGEIIRDGRFMRKDIIRNCAVEEEKRESKIRSSEAYERVERESRERLALHQQRRVQTEVLPSLANKMRAEESQAERKACDAKAAEEQRIRDKDAAEALEWFRKTADQGHVKSLSSLGSHYRKTNSVLAHMWLNIAAARGDKDAAKSRDEISKRMTPAQIAEAQKLAREWKPTKQQPR